MKLNNPNLLKDQCYIDGEWTGKPVTQVTNPATGEVIGMVPKMGTSETRKAIEGAQVAMKDWAVRTAKERSSVLRRWFELMMKHQEDPAQILTAEQGKPLTG